MSQPRLHFNILPLARVSRPAADGAGIVGDSKGSYGPGRASDRARARVDDPRVPHIAAQILVGLRCLDWLESGALRAECRAIARLIDKSWYSQLRPSGFYSFAEEDLKLSSTAARERARAHRVADRHPLIDAAWSERRLDYSRIVALEPLLSGARDRRPEVNEVLLAAVQKLTLEELQRRVRLARRAKDAGTATSILLEGVVPEGEELQRPGADISQEEERPEGRLVRLKVPLSGYLMWLRALELGRRHIGSDASTRVVVEKMLQEGGCVIERCPETPVPGAEDRQGGAEGSGDGGRSGDSDGSGDADGSGDGRNTGGEAKAAPGGPGRERVVYPDPGSVVTAQHHIDDIATLLAAARRNFERLQPHDARTGLAAYRAAARIGRDCQVLRLQLLQDAQRTGTVEHLGYRNVFEFGAAELKVSERTVRRMMHLAHIFERDPDLRQAFRRGRISMRHVHLIGLDPAIGPTCDWVGRALAVTTRQLEWEIELVRRMHELCPRIAPSGPFPHENLEDRIVAYMGLHGITRAEVQRELQVRRLGLDAGYKRAGYNPPGAPFPGSPEDLDEVRETLRKAGMEVDEEPIIVRLNEPVGIQIDEKLFEDPAANPIRTRRIEALFEMVVRLEAEKERANHRGGCESERGSTDGAGCSKAGGDRGEKEETGGGVTGAAAGEAATSDAATGDAATGTSATGEGATGRSATGEGATGRSATGEGATSHSATGDDATRSSNDPGSTATGESENASADEPPRVTESVAEKIPFLRRTVSLCFWAPHPIADDFEIAIGRIRAGLQKAWGVPYVPDWIVLMEFLQYIIAVWEQEDPDRLPVHRNLLERDNWRCAAPGCRNRKNLVVHHIVFRSAGGRDIFFNRIVLCHSCHAHGIHDGWIKLKGKAPGWLIWEIGCAHGYKPLVIACGNRILRRNG